MLDATVSEVLDRLCLEVFGERADDVPPEQTVTLRDVAEALDAPAGPANWCVWLRMPDATAGFSRIAAGLTEAQARLFTNRLTFDGQAMPDPEQPAKD